MRRAFTMIELIFVIVIIGILAAVAIPKLAATRDDAKIASEVAKGKVALKNLAATYTATGSFKEYTLNMARDEAPCFKFKGGNGGIVEIKTNGDGSCGSASVIAGVRELGYKAGISGSGTDYKKHTFGGSKISF